MKQVKILWLVAALFCATTAFGKDIKTLSSTYKCNFLGADNKQ